MAIPDWYEETTRMLLTEPVQKFMRFQPIRRTLEAMRACDQETSVAAIHARTRTDAHTIKGSGFGVIPPRGECGRVPAAPQGDLSPEL